MAKLPRHELAMVLAAKSILGVDAKRFSKEVAAYLLTEGRTNELDSLLRDIMQYRADHGIVEVIAVSAHELDNKMQRDIEAQVRGLYPAARKIIISPQHDETVIGGVRLVLANEQLDLSIRSKLNKFKKFTEAK